METPRFDVETPPFCRAGTRPMGTCVTDSKGWKPCPVPLYLQCLPCTQALLGAQQFAEWASPPMPFTLPGFGVEIHDGARSYLHLT